MLAPSRRDSGHTPFMATIYARKNHIGWIHLWAKAEAFENGEPSEHFFNSRTDPRWGNVALDATQRAALEAGQLVAIEDPGYLES